MSKQSLASRWFRFSLKSFLIVSVMGGSGIAWISHSYRGYRAEQETLDRIASRLPPSHALSVEVNGKQVSYTGGGVM